jgi:hypothetical protein
MAAVRLTVKELMVTPVQLADWSQVVSCSYFFCLLSDRGWLFTIYWISFQNASFYSKGGGEK